MHADGGLDSRKNSFRYRHKSIAINSFRRHWPTDELYFGSVREYRTIFVRVPVPGTTPWYEYHANRRGHQRVFV